MIMRRVAATAAASACHALPGARAAATDCMHPMVRAVAPAPAASINTAVGPTVADVTHVNHGGPGGYPLYAASYGPSPPARPSYGA